jgi:hypothetical protein
VGASVIIFWISLYGISLGGGNAIEGAGTLHSLKKASAPAGANMTRIRTCSESMVNECATSRGAKTIVPAVALIVSSHGAASVALRERQGSFCVLSHGAQQLHPKAFRQRA